ncbi:hypothetical protein [Dickeya phage Ds25CZ]|uniref:Uncharacterized protein n=1 Tax=Dickeya phage Ds25CZ TaxID=2686434 RepID=A0A7M3T3X7_9CAUD|nr:hypothetical protein [Dickeya phage Ds25CZ]
MKVYLLQYHDGYDGLQVQSVSGTPEAAQNSFLENAEAWGGVTPKVATQYFSVEIWDTETGCYVDDLKIELRGDLKDERHTMMRIGLSFSRK